MAKTIRKFFDSKVSDTNIEIGLGLKFEPSCWRIQKKKKIRAMPECVRKLDELRPPASDVGQVHGSGMWPLTSGQHGRLLQDDPWIRTCGGSDLGLEVLLGLSHH